MKDEEKKELEQEYENLKLLASFHEAYGVPENAKEREALINDILDRMNEIPVSYTHLTLPTNREV